METNISNKCKAYTSLEQSKQLAEFLPLDTADMVWEQASKSMSEKFVWAPSISSHPISDSQFSYKHGYRLPCWTLTALLNILPYPQLSKDKLGSGKEGWMVSVYPDNCRYDSCWHDNPVDACVEMIILLKENNRI